MPRNVCGGAPVRNWRQRQELMRSQSYQSRVDGIATHTHSHTAHPRTWPRYPPVHAQPTQVFSAFRLGTYLVLHNATLCNPFLFCPVRGAPFWGSPLPWQGLHNGTLCKLKRHSSERPFCRPALRPQVGKSAGDALGFSATPSPCRFPASMALPCPLLGFTNHVQSDARKAVSATRLRRSHRGTRRNASPPCLVVGITRRDLAATDAAEFPPLRPSCGLWPPRSHLPPLGGGGVTFWLVWLSGSTCRCVLSLWGVGGVPPPLLRAAFGRVAPPLPPLGGGGGYRLTGWLFQSIHLVLNHG